LFILLTTALYVKVLLGVLRPSSLALKMAPISHCSCLESCS